MSKTAWKQRERDAAAIFGAQRSIANSSGRADQDGSDSTHPRLHIEVKSYKRHAAWTLWCAARVAAMKARDKAKVFGRKPIVLALAQDHQAGLLLCIHEGDFHHAIEEWCVAQPQEVLGPLCVRIAARRRKIEEGELSP
jgi:hypothetical protein